MSVEIKLCPKCGSGKIDELSSLLGGDVSCLACGWSGPDKDLILRAMDEREVMTVAQSVLKDYVRLLQTEAAVPVGKAMIAAGMVGAKDRAGLTRLIKAAVSGAFKGTVEEIAKMQKEMTGGGRITQ